jgi:Cdc6-like AAA superfamily ATPase
MFTLLQNYRHLVFESYSEEDLVGIMKQRLFKNDTLIQEGAMRFLAKKVAAMSGDARSALRLIAKAIDFSRKSLTEDDLNKSGSHANVVKIPHVMKVIKAECNVPHAERIENLPDMARIVLCIATVLGQVSDEWKIMRMGQLREFCNEATDNNILDTLSIDQFKNIIDDLCDAGLLLRGENDDDEMPNERDATFESMPIRIGVQLDEVECAMEEVLLQNDFYKRMVDFVRKSQINNQQYDDWADAPFY